MFESVRIEANNARGKRIERYFGSLRYEFEKQREGWIARPFAKMESQQKGPKENKIIPYDQLVEGCINDIIDWNNMPNKQDPTLTRWQYFKNNQDPTLRQTNWRGILPHLGYCTKTSCNAGYVLLQGKKRMLALDGKILTGEALLSRMKLIETKEIEVYWLDANDGTVIKALAYRGEEFICELMPIPRYQRAKNEQTPEDDLSREVQIKYASTVEAFMRRQKNSHTEIGIILPKPQTLNRDFQIAGMKRFEVRETKVEELENFDNEEDNELVYNPNVRIASSLQSTYNI